MDKSFYFYKTTNTVNGKYYYGSGSSRKPYYGSGVNIDRAIKKYGIHNFIVEKLKFFDTREEAYLFEDRFLKLYKIANDKNSYNIKNCALGGDPFTNNPNKEVLRENYRQSMLKQLENPERRALCNSFRGLDEDEKKSRLKVWSECKEGELNGRFKYDQKVNQFDKEGNLIRVWNNVAEIARENPNLNHKYILHCCKGKLKSHGKFVWKWVG